MFIVYTQHTWANNEQAHSLSEFNNIPYETPNRHVYCLSTTTYLRKHWTGMFIVYTQHTWGNNEQAHSLSEFQQHTLWNTEQERLLSEYNNIPYETLNRHIYCQSTTTYLRKHWTGKFIVRVQQHTWGNTEQARLLSEYNSNSPTWASDLLIQLLELSPIIWGSMLPVTFYTQNVVLKFNKDVLPPPPPPQILSQLLLLLTHPLHYYVTVIGLHP